MGIRVTLYLFILLGVFPFTANATQCSTTISQGTTESCSVIQWEDITWTLSKNHTVGQFVSGDYWVRSVPGDGVIVSSVSPGRALVSGYWMDGSMKNPVPMGSQGLSQAARIFSAAQMLTFPHTFHAGDAMLSSIRHPNWATETHRKLRKVGVLTFLPANAPSGSFRPGYCDRDQTLYNISQINSAVIPTHPVPAVMPSDEATLLANISKRPWSGLFIDDWSARTNHPTDNMPSYHRDVGHTLSRLMCFLATNHADKQSVLYGFLQIVIDYRYTRAADSSTWLAPIVVGGLILDETSFVDYWIDNPSLIPRTREGDKMYYIGDRSTSAVSTIVPVGQTWIPWQTAEGKYVAWSKQAGQEYEHIDPCEWTGQMSSDEFGYRSYNDLPPLIGQHVAAHMFNPLTLIDIGEKMSLPAGLDYAKKWMEDGMMTDEYKTSGKTYYQHMLDCVGGSPSSTHSYGTSRTAWIDALYEDYVKAPPAYTCTDLATLCTTALDCTTNWGDFGYAWVDGVCQIEAEPPPQVDTCQESSSMCESQNDCATHWPTYNWCTDTCQEAACPVVGGGGTGGTPYSVTKRAVYSATKFAPYYEATP